VHHARVAHRDALQKRMNYDGTRETTSEIFFEFPVIFPVTREFARQHLAAFGPRLALA
jgi:hypothetical protein